MSVIEVTVPAWVAVFTVIFNENFISIFSIENVDTILYGEGNPF